MSTATELRVGQKLLPLMDGWRPEWSDLVLALVETLDRPSVVEALRSTGMNKSTVHSRLLRAGLPSPKAIHQGLRFYAYLVLRQRQTHEKAAYCLGWSSPQSCGRSIREQVGTTSRAFAATPPDTYWEQFVREVLRPAHRGWRERGSTAAAMKGR